MATIEGEDRLLHENFHQLVSLDLLFFRNVV